MVTFLVGVLVETATIIDVRGSKPTIPEWRMGIW
jgi:hypothetical protein